MKNVRQADMGEYLPLTSLLLLRLWGLGGEMVRGVCVFYTQAVFQTLGFLLIFMLFLLAVTLALPWFPCVQEHCCLTLHRPLPGIHFQECQHLPH